MSENGYPESLEDLCARTRSLIAEAVDAGAWSVAEAIEEAQRVVAAVAMAADATEGLTETAEHTLNAAETCLRVAYLSENEWFNSKGP